MLAGWMLSDTTGHVLTGAAKATRNNVLMRSSDTAYLLVNA
jgi:hypothetical protein